jgi:hypothetical protein
MFWCEVTYPVPTALIVFLVFSSPKSLDKPKSAIFGFILLSSNILAGFKSKCHTENSNPCRRYSKPWHIPLIILYCICQLSPEHPSAVDKNAKKHVEILV